MHVHDMHAKSRSGAQMPAAAAVVSSLRLRATPVMAHQQQTDYDVR
jgi:hypothetical protein